MNTFKPHSKLLHYDYLLDMQPTSEKRKAEYYLHMHNDYELLFFYKGDAEYTIETQNYRLKTNDLLLIKPMVYHGLNVLSSKPYERCIFNLSGAILTQEQKRLLEQTSPIHHIDEQNPIRLIFDTLRAGERDFDKQEFEYLINSSLYNILSTMAHLPIGKRLEEAGNGKLNEIIEYIHYHPELPLNTSALAERFFVSKSWIDHAFKENLKMSPKKYINQKKILHAQSLIMSGTPITKAAEQCRYINYATFYRQYVYFLGHEPIIDRKDLLPPTKPRKNNER